MARTDPQVNIRLPADLKARLDVEASAANRSLTAEIVHRLEKTIWQDGFTSRHFTMDAVEELIQTEKTIETLHSELTALQAASEALKAGKKNVKWIRPRWMKPDATIDDAIDDMHVLVAAYQSSIANARAKVHELLNAAKDGKPMPIAKIDEYAKSLGIPRRQTTE